MYCCRFFRSSPPFSIFYPSISPPFWRPSSILPYLLWLSVRPSPLPLFFASFRSSLLRPETVEPHPLEFPSSRSCLCRNQVFFGRHILFFKKKFNDWNRQPRGSLSDSTFPPCQPPTPYTMEWQPQQEPLRQLACCLRNSLDGYNRTAQKEAEQVSVSISPSAHACLLPPPHFDFDLLPRGIVD